jgi:hypothetical protein
MRKKGWRGREGLGTGSRHGAGVQPGAGKVDPRLLEGWLFAISSREVGLRVPISRETPISSPRMLHCRRGENLGRGGCSRWFGRRREGLVR